MGYKKLTILQPLVWYHFFVRIYVIRNCCLFDLFACVLLLYFFKTWISSVLVTLCMSQNLYFFLVKIPTQSESLLHYTTVLYLNFIPFSTLLIKESFWEKFRYNIDIGKPHKYNSWCSVEVLGGPHPYHSLNLLKVTHLSILCHIYMVQCRITVM